MKEPLIYIIILNWNGSTDTIECIRSIEKNTYKNYKILIVDNNSTDNSATILENKFPKHKIIKNNINLGYAEGNNVGIRYAMQQKAEYVMLLNNDTIVDKYFLTTLIETTQQDRKIGIASPLIYYKNNHKYIWSSGGYKSFINYYPFQDEYIRKIDNGQLENVLKRDCVTGCSMLIRRDVINQIGYLNKEYFIYAEDMDYCIRAKKSGFAIIVNTKSKVWHRVSGSSGGEGNITKEYYNTRNLLLFANNNLHGFEKMIFITFYIIGRSINILKLLFEMKFNESRASLKGLFDGIKGNTGIVSRI